MEKFIICLDEDTSNSLIGKGAKFIRKEAMSNKTYYILENSEKLTFSEGKDYDKSKVIFTNKMMF